MIQHSSTSLTEIKIFMGGGLFIATARIPVFQKIEDGIIQDYLNYGSFRSTLGFLWLLKKKASRKHQLNSL